MKEGFYCKCCGEYKGQYGSEDDRCEFCGALSLKYKEWQESSDCGKPELTSPYYWNCGNLFEGDHDKD